MSGSSLPTFGNKYKAIELIIKTRMSIIYKAIRPSIPDRFYAIKIMSDDAPFNAPELILAKEIAILKKLQGGPHIVQYVEDSLEKGKRYLVMDFVEGMHPLKGYSPGSKLYIKDDVIKTFVVQVAQALKHVHDNGFCHCDVRPDNILIVPDKGAVLFDFGLAVELKGRIYKYEDGDERLHLDHQLNRTYFSPQHFTDGMDPTGDQYSLALFVIQCMCGGELPPPIIDPGPDPDGKKKQEAIEQQNFSPGVANVLKIALMDNPNQRYRSIENFASELVAALNAEMVNSQHKLPPAKTDATDATNTTPKFGPATPKFNASPHSSKTQTTAQPKTPPGTFGRRSVLAMAISGAIALPLTWIKLGPRLFQSPQQQPSAQFGDLIRVYQGHPDAVNALSWSPDNQSIVSVSADSVQVWKPGNEDDRYVHASMGANILDVAWSPFPLPGPNVIDTSYIAFCSGNKVYVLFDFPDPILQEIYAAPGLITSLDWSPNNPGMLAIAGSNGMVQVLEVSQFSGTIHSTRKNIYDASTMNTRTTLSKVAWSQDSSFLAVCSQAASPHVWIWNVDNTPKRLLNGPANVLSIAWFPPSGNPDNSLAIGLANNLGNNNIPYIHVWKDAPDSENPQEDYSSTDDFNGIDSIAWSPGGTYIAAGSAPTGNVYVWNTRAKTPTQRFDKHHRNSSDFSLSSNRNVSIRALAWSPNGTMIASGGTDNTVLVWASGISAF